MSSDDEEDWFEKALREGEESDDAELDWDEEFEETNGEFADENGSGESSDPFGGDANAGDGSSDPFGGVRREPDEAGDQPTADPFGDEASGGTADDAFDSEANAGGAANTGGASGGAGAGEPDDGFDGGSGSAEDPFGGVRDGAPEDPFGGPGSAEDPFGGVRATNDEGDDPFGDDFEAAMGAAGAGGEEFDEAEFESDIGRIDVGIEGLDEMILGGVPVRSLITVIGSAGTGKTTFGLQFLQESLAQGGRCVYITLEETHESIVSSAEEKGWPFSEYVERGNLVVVSMDPIEMANSLDSIRSDLTRLINDFGCDRLVLDSVSLLEMMYDDPARRRSEVFDFARSLKGAGVTTLLTSEASGDNAFQSRHGLVEYLVDAVFVLRYVRPSDFQETRLAVEIQKIRDANHSRETKPYDITDEGIDVYRQANLF